MKNLFKIFICVAITGIFSACSIGQHTYNATRTTDLSPDIVRLDLTLSDFEFLGEVNINVEYRTYLKGITVYESINGEVYNRRLSRHVSFAGKSPVVLSFPLRKATYKVIETYPDADYYVPVFTDRISDNLFLGSRIKEEAVFKVYKLKK
jgi:hypothetical protein